MQGVLAARIDRLAPDEKALLQQLAVIGREFPLSLVRQVITQPEEELYRLLASLQRKEFLYEQPAFPEVEYIFKHALTQEVAYGTVLQERRKALHERTAQAIEALYHDQLRGALQRAGASLQSQWQHGRKPWSTSTWRGNRRCSARPMRKRSRHLTTALELLKTLPDTPERAQQELTLQLTLGVPLLMATRGFAAPEVEASLYPGAGAVPAGRETRPALPGLRGLWAFHLMRGELLDGARAGGATPELWPSRSKTRPCFWKHIGHWESPYSIWESLVAAQTHLEQGLLCMTLSSTAPWFLYGIDPGVLVPLLCWLGPVVLGYPDQALQRSQEALTLAQELSHPFSLAVCPECTLPCSISSAGRASSLKSRQRQRSRSRTSKDFRTAWRMGLSLRGWALAEQGQGEEGIAQIRQGLATCQATGAELCRPYYLALLAEAYGKAGQEKKGWLHWPRRWRWWTKLGSGFTRRSCIGSKGNSCWRRQGNRQRATVNSQ